MTRTHTVADRLVDRLAELGVDRIFGVPGDYCLGLLDHIVHHPSVTWTGATNELNAGYAADGYARMHGMAALCTTFGVGELSAINAIAGSYAEHVPVVHIVGSPALAKQAQHRPVHHTLGDGEFGHFAAMHTDITCARATLTVDNAAAEIDRVVVAARDLRLPGYLLLPAGVTFVGQPLWASIGYTLPALLGACTARPGRRGVLLIGDGAAQMTVQELSTVLRLGLHAVIVVVDNDGYTVERAIHGPNEPYNDIAAWDWTAAPALFAPAVSGATAVRASTVGELRTALATATGFTLIQAVVPRDDVPDLLRTLTRVLGGRSDDDASAGSSGGR